METADYKQTSFTPSDHVCLYQISYTETMRRSAAQPRSSFALEGSIVVYSSNSTDSTVVSNPSIADIQ